MHEELCFSSWQEVIKKLRPKIAVGENVKGLLTHDNGNTLKAMLSILNDLGYRVAFKVLRAQYLDVPQKRERLLIIAVRSDLEMPILFPKERDYTISMREALENVPLSEGQNYPLRRSKHNVISSTWWLLERFTN